MTWTGGRRPGWIPRTPRDAHPGPHGPAGIPQSGGEPVQPAPVMVPDFPCFSPAAAAQVVGRHRATVQYWLDNGKLEFFKDNIGERYILRAELIRFIHEYLQRPV